MRVSYGTPGQRGVTHLVAVGDVEDDNFDWKWVWASAAVAGLGQLAGSKTLRSMGAGGMAVLLLQRWAKKNRTVEVAATK